MNLLDLNTYDFVIMWGAGADSEWYNNQFKVDFMVDKNQNKFGQQMGGVIIKPVSYLNEIDKEKKILIIVSSSKYCGDIKKEIHEMCLNADVVELSIMKMIYCNKNISYALWGIDILVRDLAIRGGYDISNMSYIEIGACHPIAGSNTYIMYKEGARGYLIEPNPDLQDLLKKYRNDTCLLQGIASNKGSMDFYRFDNEYRNTFDEKLAEKTRQDGFNLRDIVRLPVVTLDDVIEKYNIDTNNTFLSIQAMGLELEILQKYDYTKYNFPIIAVAYYNEKIFEHPMFEYYKIIASVPRHIVLVNKEIYNRVLG